MRLSSLNGGCLSRSFVAFAVSRWSLWSCSLAVLIKSLGCGTLPWRKEMEKGDSHGVTLVCDVGDEDMIVTGDTVRAIHMLRTSYVQTLRSFREARSIQYGRRNTWGEKTCSTNEAHVVVDIYRVTTMGVGCCSSVECALLKSLVACRYRCSLPVVMSTRSVRLRLEMP